MDTLVRLEKDITDWVEEKRTASYNFKPKEGEIVVVKCVGETSFNRARVIKMLGLRQMVEEDSLEVSSSDIAECMVEYVERLPFQVIMCTLAEIGPTGKEWSSEVGDRIFDMTRDMDTDEAMMIDCVVVEIVEDQYKVKLRNGLNLAQDLVDSGLAEWPENSVESSFDSLEQQVMM